MEARSSSTGAFAARKLPDARELFERLTQHLREEVPGSDPAATDPVLRLLLRCFAMELAEVYSAVDATEEYAFHALLRRFLTVPRGPLPAEVVARFEVRDPGRRLGRDSGLAGTKRDLVAGKPVERRLEFRFRETCTFGLFHVPAVIRIRSDGDASLTVFPAPKAESARAAAKPEVTHRWRTAQPPRPTIVFCVDEQTTRPAGVSPQVFVAGPDVEARSVLWGAWLRAGENEGGGSGWTPAAYVPPSFDADVEDVLSYRSDRHRAGVFDGRFVRLPITDAQADRIPQEAAEVLDRIPPPVGRRWWWLVRLPARADLQLDAIDLLTDCAVLENRTMDGERGILNDLTKQEIQLRVGFSELGGIEEVRDLTAGATFLPADRPGTGASPYTYLLRNSERTGKVLVHLRAPTHERRNGHFEVRYFTNAGQAANGVDPSVLTQLVTAEAGVARGYAVTPTAGGQDARIEQGGVDEEVRTALRHHGRAVTPRDYADIARSTGGAYVSDVDVRPGVRLTTRGAEPCVDVMAWVRENHFVSELEREASRSYLEHLLASRSPVATVVRVTFLPEEARE